MHTELYLWYLLNYITFYCVYFCFLQMRSILRNHQTVIVIILSTYLISRREKISLFKILVNHCKRSHNLLSYQSLIPKVSSMYNKYMINQIFTYELDIFFIKSSCKKESKCEFFEKMRIRAGTQ